MKPASTIREVISDPCELMVFDALEASGVKFTHESEGRQLIPLDFFLPDEEMYIEVKQFHSPRLFEQMSRTHNVIGIQGAVAVEWFCKAIAK